MTDKRKERLLLNRIAVLENLMEQSVEEHLKHQQEYSALIHKLEYVQQQSQSKTEKFKILTYINNQTLSYTV